MQTEPKITFRDIVPSQAIRDAAEKGVKHVGGLFSRGVNGLHLVVSVPHRRHHKGERYLVRVNLLMSDGRVLLAKDAGENLYLAIKDALVSTRKTAWEYFRRERNLHRHARPHRIRVVAPVSED